MIRRLLDTLYLFSGALAAVFLFLIAATIVAQIVSRFFGFAIDSTESGGFCLAGTTFLGMAYTLKSGGQIRVELLIGRLGSRTRRVVEITCCAGACLGTAIMAWQTAGMMHDSWRFGDLSPGLLAIPIWIPQAVMLSGIVILAIAFLDELVLVLRGRQPGYASGETAELDEISAAANTQTRDAETKDIAWTR